MRRWAIILTAAFLGQAAPAQESGDASLLDVAFAAVAVQDYDMAYALVGKDPLHRDLLTWTRLREGVGTFAEYRAFVAARPDWPGLDRMRARGEEVIDEGADPRDVLDWFAETAPQTGQGAVSLARALIETGNRGKAEAVLRDAWLSLGLTEEGHAAMMAAYPDVLAPYHAARTDAMLWRWRTSDAARMLPLLDAPQRALAEARIALIRKTGDAAAKLAAVPAELADSTGLAYDRLNWLADRGDWTEAVALLTSRTDNAQTMVDPERWASWRRVLSRWLMREGRAEEAYALAARHHLAAGESYADLEWLAGYLSLRFLDKPAQALIHFQALDAAVDSPISAGRAGYWLGRTYEALGRPDAAAAAYGRAAQNQTAFYGLLAAEKLGQTLDPALTGGEVFPDPAGSSLLTRDDTRAAFALLDANQRSAAVLFFAQMGQTLDRIELGQMADILHQRDEPFFEVLLGKAAVTRGIVIPQLYFPIHDLAKMDLPVAPELALSIARRESEFNASVGSPVGALGLMQLMPATAEEVASELGLPYSRGRLTADWQYNATLGTAYLAGLQEKFGDSPVMIAAGYNAGASRPSQWISERGDPRRGDVDVIDWIEAIPFRETRNYVQRVTESIPVYQARLSGQTGPIAFTQLLIGKAPLIRPQARPARDTAPIAIATETPPAVKPPPDVRLPPLLPVIRPLARPEG
jgi:soluble lytic murein transglycosylase